MSSSIKRTPAGSWQVRFRDQAGRQRAKNFKRRVDAEAFHNETRTRLRRGSYIDPDAGRERFIDFAERWSEARDWKATTRPSFEAALRRIVERLGEHVSLDSIDRLLLERLQQQLRADYAHATVRLTMHFATTIMRAAYQAGSIGRDPTVGIKPLRRRAGDRDRQVGPDDVPTRADALAILHGAPDRYRAAIALGISGLRIGEVLAVSADRLDLESRELLVDQQVQHVDGSWQLTAPKRDKARRIVLPTLAVLEVRRHLRDHQGAGLLFRGPRSGQVQRRDMFYRAAWRPALTAAGFDPYRFKFHALRHFCASSMLAEGAPVPAVAGHLGDVPETVMSTYAHWLRDDRHVPALVLDRLLAVDESEAATGTD